MYDPWAPPKPPKPPRPTGARQVIGTILLVLAGLYYPVEVFLLGFFSFSTDFTYSNNRAPLGYLTDMHTTIGIIFFFELAIAITGLVLWIRREVQRKPIFILGLIIIGAQFLTNIAFWAAVYSLGAMYQIAQYKS